MIDALLALYREGGLSLMLVVVLIGGCALLYRDARSARAALLEAERRHVRDVVSVALKLGRARLQGFGNTDPPPPLLQLAPDRDDHRQLESKRDHAWRLIERHLNQISGGPLP